MSARSCASVGGAALALTLLSSLAGCANTARLLREQELGRLTSQVGQTDAALREFAAVADPEGASQFTVLIPASLLNDVLTKFDETVIDPPDPALQDIRIIVKQIRTRFDAALPYVDITLSACRRPQPGGPGCGDLSVSLSATAYLEFSVNRTVPPLNATLRVQLVDAVPSAQVKWWQFKLQGFVRDLIRAQLAQAIATKLPAAVVPLETAFGVTFPAGGYRVSIPAPRQGSRIDTLISTPGLSEQVALTVFRVLFLRDGVHLFLQVE